MRSCPPTPRSRGPDATQHEGSKHDVSTLRTILRDRAEADHLEVDSLVLAVTAKLDREECLEIRHRWSLEDDVDPTITPQGFKLSLYAVAMLSLPVIAARSLHCRCCMQTRLQSMLA